ncbi:MAG: OmpA family protein [Bacteroidetes bacterium]|nr:OmpA family protein [Bacteroidota bacterium]HET6245494.1 OmpA family protein [Bacteroidia bacterium]
MLPGKTFISIFISLLLTVSSFAQNENDKKLFQEAKKFFEARKFVEALPHFKQLNENDPGNISYYYRLGACLAMTEQEPEKALDMLKMTLNAQPKSVEVHVFLMKAYLLLGNNELLEKHYKILLSSEDEVEISKWVELANDILNQSQFVAEEKMEEEKIALIAKSNLDAKTAAVENPSSNLKSSEPETVNTLATNGLPDKGAKSVEVKTKTSTARSKTQVSRTIPIKNVKYAYAKSDVNENYKSELKELIGLMKENKEMKLELTGHTDSNGTDKYNLILGENRARTVQRYFMNNGISASRISVISKGESQPLAPNENGDGSDNIQGREQNRRVEIKIINPPAFLTVDYQN